MRSTLYLVLEQITCKKINLLKHRGKKRNKKNIEHDTKISSFTQRSPFVLILQKHGAVRAEKCGKRRMYRPGHHSAGGGHIIAHCNTSLGSSANLSCSSPPPGRCRDSLCCWNRTCTRGQRSRPVALTSSGAGSNSPGGCTAGSAGIAPRQSSGDWTLFWWASHSRKKTRRRRSPVASSCYSPGGCRASESQPEKLEPGSTEVLVRIWDFDRRLNGRQKRHTAAAVGVTAGSGVCVSPQLGRIFTATSVKDSAGGHCRLM